MTHCHQVGFQGIVGLLVGLGLLGVWSSQSQAQSCPLQHRYDQCVFLTTHNAFANWDDGWWVHAQQSYKTVRQQLDEGVRALMLDIYKFQDLTHAEDIYLCHGSCELSIVLRALLPIPLRRLRDTLVEIRQFLEANPHEVVTIFFESYIDGDEARLKQAFVDSGTWNYLFLAHEEVQGPTTGDTWKVLKKNTCGALIEHAWPPVQWMVDNNKRLVAFSNEGGPTRFLPYQYDYTIETVYSDESLDSSKWCNQRGESQPQSGPLDRRTLSVMNHFPSACCPISPEPAFAFATVAACVPVPLIPICYLPVPGIIPPGTMGLILGAAAIAAPAHYGLAVNDADNIRTHVNSCRPTQPELPTFPNFLAVDYFEIGEHGGPQQVMSELRQSTGAPACALKTDYGPGGCSGTIAVDTLAGLAAYVQSNFGKQGGPYFQHLKIRADLSDTTLDITSPCQITLASGVDLSGEFVSLDGRKGVQVANGSTITAQTACVLSEHDSVHIGGQVSADTLTVQARQTAQIGQDAVVQVAGPLRVLSTGDFDSSDAIIKAGAQVQAGALEVVASRGAHLGENTTVRATTVTLRSTGNKEGSDAGLNAGAEVTAARLTISASGGAKIGQDTTVTVSEDVRLESTGCAPGSEAIVRSGAQVAVGGDMVLSSGNQAMLGQDITVEVQGNFFMNAPALDKCTVDRSAQVTVGGSSTGRCATKLP